jgi:GT2 family glycosyltransferase
MQLLREIEGSCSLRWTVTIIDNGPNATDADWGEELAGRVIVRPDYLGSEQAFLLGLRCAPEANWYLLLDHDAHLQNDTLPALLSVAKDPGAAYSCNQNGDGSSWDRHNGRAPAARNMTTSVISVEFAPWSGLLLGPRAVQVLRSHDSGLFFYWDDYLACWLISRAGVKIWGVPAAVVENENIAYDRLSPWRAYYKARNNILFYRDTGHGSLIELALVQGKDLFTALIHCHLKRFRAVCMGIIDGVRNRRGPQMTPM